MTFVHLHCHSDRSIGRGLIKPSELVAHYKRIGASAACITDYGNLNSAVQLNGACRRHGLLPVFGMEVNVAPDKRNKKQGSESLVLLAKNKVGFYNLIRLASIGSMYFYYIPRVDLDTIRDNSQGLIALTSDIQGVAAHAYFRAQEDGVAELHKQYSDIFGDDVYYEIQPVPTESQRVVNEGLIDLSDSVSGINIVATGQPHYLLEADSVLHESLLRSRNFRSAYWEYPFKGRYHVRSYDEMMDDFSSLHGFDVRGSSPFVEAMDCSNRILSKIESFDLREGTKVPSYA